MSRTFGAFADKIASAQTETARRQLLGEVGVWRAQRLTDIAAQRQAAHALSELHHLLGDTERAVHEAEQLVQLCRVAPEAAKEVQHAARKQLRRVSPKAARAKDAAPRGGDALADAVAALSAGRHDAALAAVRGRKGTGAALLRVAVSLDQALRLEGTGRDAALVALRDDLVGRVSGGRPSAPAAPDPRAAPAGGDTDSALAQLVGSPLPRKRRARVDALEAFAAAHPAQIDALAATALEDHLASAGPGAYAPWLYGFTARAFAAGPAAATRAALDLARSQGSVAVAGYDEAPFERLVGLLRHGAERGLSYAGLRRGLLRHGEPDARTSWTLRLARDGVDGMVAVAPASDEPLDDALAVALGKRLSELTERGVLLAPGAGNAGLRAAAVASGVQAFDEADDRSILQALVEQLDAAPARTSAPRAEAAPSGRRDARAPREASPAKASPKPGKPEGPSPMQRLRDLVVGETPPTEAALAEPLGQLRRHAQAFRPLRGALGAMSPADRDARLAPYLRAVHAAAPASVVIPEGITVAVRSAAEVADGAVHDVLRDAGDLGARFGGPGIEGLVAAVSAAVAAGWSVHRVERGVTPSERKQHAALGALGDRVSGLWRAWVRRGRDEVALWFLGPLSPEAQAAVPVLLAVEGPRVVVTEAPEQAASLSALGVQAVETPGVAEALAAAAPPPVDDPAPVESGAVESAAVDEATPSTPADDGAAVPVVAEPPSDEGETVATPPEALG